MPSQAASIFSKPLDLQQEVISPLLIPGMTGAKCGNVVGLLDQAIETQVAFLAQG